MRSIWKPQIKYNSILNFKSSVLPRTIQIPQEFVDTRISVYTGNKISKVFIASEMIGSKLGEFVLTRKRCVHKKVKKQKKN